MTKEDFLKLFELEIIYEKYRGKNNFCFSYHDRFLGTENAVFFSFSYDYLRISVESIEFSPDFKVKEIKITLDISDIIKFDKNKEFKNELFEFLNLDEDLDVSLKFLAGYINKILIPKYNLTGGVLVF